MNNLSKIRRQISKLRKERYSLERRVVSVREMVKGTVIKHYKKCGNKGCACAEGRLHGPYWYLSFKESNKAHLEYIRIKDLARIKYLAGNYKRFQSSVTRINVINREINMLMSKLRKKLIKNKKQRAK